MSRKSGGFTLIELMIVVAIIGVLAAISMPLYQGHMLRTQVNQVVSELSVYRTTYEVNLANNNSIDNTNLKYKPSPYTNGTPATQIGTANADGSGHLQVTMGGSAHPSLAGTIVRFERSAQGIWSFLIDRSAASDWHGSYEPPNCTAN